jgi:putative protein-disulfide isomerase
MKKTLIISCLLVYSFVLKSQNNINNFPMKENDQIVYVYDALCGWCFGFSNVISEIEKKYSNKIKFTVLSGGMIIGNREGVMDNETRKYIQNAIPRLEKTCHVKFGQNYFDSILNNPNHFSSSLMPAIAMSVLKSIDDSKAVPFVKKIQNALFIEGKNLNDLNTYKTLALELGLNPDDFIKKMQDPYYTTEAKKEFELVKQIGINGFPTLFIIKNGEATLLSSGYSDYKDLSKKFDSFFN